MNATAQHAETQSLYLKHTFNAPIETVFRARTDPAMLKQWFGPIGVSTVAAEVDLRPGGRYRITMKTPEGELVTHYGDYREIDPPLRLVFTWLLDGQGCEGSRAEINETLVSLEFIDLGGATEVVLTHERFMTETARDMHAFGWNGCFDCLDALLA